MPKYDYRTVDVIDSKNVTHKIINPRDCGNMTQYLSLLMDEAGKNPVNRDYLVNIMAARMAKKVLPNKRSALDAMVIANDTNDWVAPIAEEQKKLFDCAAMQDYLKSRSDEQLKTLVSSGGHGGKLERDFAKHVCMHKGPMPVDTPKRYLPTALTRIEVLQKQLKSLPKDGHYVENAAKICMEIAATRAAVDCERGKKSTLKKTVNAEQTKRYYDGLVRTAGACVDRNNIDRLVKGALAGHGGAMDQEIQTLVREDMQRNHRTPDADVPTRYQVTRGERMDALREEISGCLDVIKKGQKLEPQKKQQLKEALGEMAYLGEYANKQEAPVDDLRIDQKNGALSDVRPIMASSEGINRLVDKLEGGEDVVDELSVALKWGRNKKVYSIALTEINEAAKEKLNGYREEQAKKQQDQIAIEDLEVEGKVGSELSKEMSDQLTNEALDIKLHEPNLDNPDKINPDSIRKLRVICDKRMAIMRAFQKSQDPNTKQVDQQKFARELNGERFKQNIREVRQDPVYQRTMKDMTAKAQKTKEGIGPTLCEAAWYPAGSLEPLIVKTAKKMQMEAQNPEAQKNLAKQQNDPQKLQVLG